MQKRPVPILGRENHKRWFQAMEDWLFGKDLFRTIQEQQYETPSSTSEDGAKAGKRLSSSWARTDAQARYWIRQCISEDDQEIVGDEITAKGIWDTLKKKYAQNLKVSLQQLEIQFLTYQMDDTTTIDNAWSHLAKLGRAIKAGDNDTSYHKPEKRLKQLLNALPAKYMPIRQTVRAQDGEDYDAILLMLKEEEMTIQGQESAIAARDSGRSRGKATTANCHLCDEKGHWMKDCPHLSKAKAQLKEQKSARRRSLPKSPPRSSEGFGKPKRSTSPEMRQILQKLEAMSTEISALKRKQGRSKAFQAKDQTDRESDSPPLSPGKSDSEVELAGSAAVARGKLQPKSEWMLDSGASSHMTDQRGLFRGPLIRINRRWIKVGGGWLHSDSMGEAIVTDGSGKEIKLLSLFVPELGVNLISCRKLCKDYNLNWTGNEHSLQLVTKNNIPILGADEKGGVYVLRQIHKGLELIQSSLLPQPSALFVQTTQDNQWQSDDQAFLSLEEKQAQYQLWHRRFAHLGTEKIRGLNRVTQLETLIPIAPQPDHPCDTCSITNLRRQKGKSTERRNRVLALVSVDISGPFENSRLNERLFLQIVDNYSRKTWSIPLQSRSSTQQTMQKWRAQAERETETKLQALRSDNAPEILQQLRQWEMDGVKIHSTEAYNSLQNGVPERSIQTAQRGMRAMLEDSGLPNEFWADALRANTYLRNYTATGPEIDGSVVSPEEAYSGVRPSIDHIRVWGCKMHSHLDPRSLPQGGRQDKLMNRGRVGVFLGYVEDTTKQYWMWAPDMRRAIKVSASSVRFFEHEKGGSIDLGIPIKSTSNHAPRRNPVGRPRQQIEQPQETIPRRIFSHVEIPQRKGIQAERDEVNQPTQEEPHSNTATSNRPDQPEQAKPDSHTTEPSKEPTVELRGIKRPREEEFDEDSSEEPLMKQLRALLGREDCAGEILSALVVKEMIPIPSSYEEAINDLVWGKMWKAAFKKELDDLAANGTWEEVVPPKDANLVSSKWVLAAKHTAEGALERLKARLVARGFSQRYGIDYQETFAPTVRHDTLRAFLAIVALQDMECHVVDVNNAFTESFLKEKIYMKPPPGVEVKPGHVFQILRSLYGLKQAARDWNQKCTKALLDMGFTQSKADPCLFQHLERDIILIVYVDDIPLASKSLKQVEWFKTEFAKQFKIKDLGEIQKILGVRVTRDRKNRTIKLDQTRYIQEVLEKIGMATERSRPTKSPMENYKALQPADAADLRTDKSDYQRTIGHWMYLGILTRPDISFSLNRLSQYLSDPAEFHSAALKKVSRYIRSSADLEITYGPSEKPNLQGYSDSDYASDKTDRRSILGYIFTLGGGPISWISKKQKSIATSTMEAEYMAMNACAKKAQFLAQIIRDMGQHSLIGDKPWNVQISENQKFAIGSPIRPVRLFGDNQASLSLVKERQTHDRAKHIDVAYHYIRELYEKGRISVQYVRTTDMLADGLTKPRVGADFSRFVTQIGLTRRHKVTSTLD